MEGQVAWLGSPLALDYPSMSGSFHVNVEAGQFLKADPGLAKLLGVLSLQSLPRRLALDFRDVFTEGFAFDFVRGDITIQQGIAATNNLQMKGVNAAVLMEGKADIATRNAGPQGGGGSRDQRRHGLAGGYRDQPGHRPGHLPGADVPAPAADARGHAGVPDRRHLGRPAHHPDQPRAPRRGPAPTPSRNASGATDQVKQVMMKVAAIQMVSGVTAAGATSTAPAPCSRRRREPARELAVLPEYFCLMGQRGQRQAGGARAASARRRAGLPGRHGARAGPVDRRRHPAAGRRRRAPCAQHILVFSPAGECVARYDKIHLFQFDNGRERYDESRVIESGSEPVAFELRDRDGHGWRVGLSVCYDLRFPELYRALAGRRAAGAQRLHLCAPARRIGNCCCAPARSRTWPT